MSKKNQNDWMKAIQLTKDTSYERNLQLYLKKSLHKAKLVDIPCFIDEIALKKASELKKKVPNMSTFFSSYNYYLISGYNNIRNIEFEDVNPGSIQALIATQNLPPNSSLLMPEPKIYIDWPSIMRSLAKDGNLNMIKVLSPLLSNPDAPVFNHDLTPIYYASRFGHLEIVKFLAPLAEINDSPRVRFAIDVARIYGHDDIVEYYLNSIIKSK